MPNAPREAVKNATLLPQIGFAEFTARLISDTFHAITSSYIEQTGLYMKLVETMTQTLQEYINNTADDISAEEINAFLVSLGGLNDDALNFLLGDPAPSASLNAAEATVLNNALALPAAAGPPPASPPAAAGALNNAKRQTIAQAIGRRLAANKYDLLQTMVRQGMMRLYVDNGSIETRLTFTTYGQAQSSSTRTNRQQAQASTSTQAGANIGGRGSLLGFLSGAQAGTNFSVSTSTLQVSTASASQRDVSGSRVQIFGRVQLNFKTDLLPLNASPV